MKPKPCWCGCKEIDVMKSEMMDEDCVVVRCSDCGLQIKRMAKTIKTAKAKAIEAWNTRPYYERDHGKRARGPD